MNYMVAPSYESPNRTPKQQEKRMKRLANKRFREHELAQAKLIAHVYADCPDPEMQEKAEKARALIAANTPKPAFHNITFTFVPETMKPRKDGKWLITRSEAQEFKRRGKFVTLEPKHFTVPVEIARFDTFGRMTIPMGYAINSGIAEALAYAQERAAR